jgi:hypothetical protein
VILIFGPWSFASLFEEEEHSWSRVEGPVLREGEFEGCRLYWSISLEDTQCMVFLPDEVGRILWRRVTPEPGEAQEEGGRLLVGVRKISPDLAATLLEANPALATRDGETTVGEAAVRRLQKDVHVRVLEQLTWIPGSSAGQIFALPPGRQLP